MPENSPASISANISADLTKTSELFVKNTAKGVRKLFSLFCGKREADIIRHRVLTAAQTQVDEQNILAGEAVYSNGKLLSARASLGELMTRSSEAREKDNLFAAMRLAAEKTASFRDDEISDDPVDETWFLRWQREAAAVSREDLRSLLANLLAENIKQPSAVSLRTLDVAKNLSQRDCRNFVMIAPFIFNDRFLLGTPDPKKYPEGCSFDLILQLAGAGLLTFPSASHLVFSPPKTIDAAHKPWSVIKNDMLFFRCSGEKFFLHCFALTAEGVEILKVTSMPDLTQEQLDWIADFLVNECNAQEVRAFILKDRDRIGQELPLHVTRNQ
jgi:hypothetical protein